MTTSMLAAIVCASARLPSNDARRTNALPPRQHGLDPIELRRRHDPVADGDVGADVAHPQRLGVEVAQHRAPARSRRVTRPGSSARPECSPRRIQLLTPAESNVTPFVDNAEGSVAELNVAAP